jgi:peptidoglycan/LPS O-acetylase OafA/YrhL
MGKTSDNFVLLRLIMALLVAFSHSYALAGRSEPMIFAMPVGGFAVYCFFAVSGYLIVGSYLTTARPELFAWKRFWRIAPALILAIPFSLLLYYAQERYAGTPVPGFSNGSLWTLSWVALMYVLTLLLGMMGLLTAPVIGATFLTSSILFFGAIHAPSPALAVVAPFFLLFLEGGMIRLTEDRLDLRKCGILAGGIILLASLPVSKALFDAAPAPAMFAFGPGLSWEELYRFIMLVGLPFALLFVARRFPVPFTVRTDYSYGIFIFAWPIQETLVYQLSKHGIPFGPRILFAASAIASFGCAAISWHLIEKRALRFSHSKFNWTVWRLGPAAKPAI